MEKRFHFQEMGWIIRFPNSGNHGKKYSDYSVFLSEGKKNTPHRCICLADIVESPDFQEKLPHTVGFFKSEKDAPLKEDFRYLEMRMIRSVEDFWKFLNDVDL